MTAAASLVVYSRDYCGYCFRLERALNHANVAYDRRDIHEDREAAAFVRSVNNGDETVPTVVINGTDVRVNPKPADLLQALGVEPEPSLWTKLAGGHRN